MAGENSIVYTFHIFFIPSVTDAHLSWSYNMTIVNSTATTMGMHKKKKRTHTVK
jgi:hypothetical protein